MEEGEGWDGSPFRAAKERGAKLERFNAKVTGGWGKDLEKSKSEEEKGKNEKRMLLSFSLYVKVGKGFLGGGKKEKGLYLSLNWKRKKEKGRKICHSYPNFDLKKKKRLGGKSCIWGGGSSRGGERGCSL